jgi:hypothetical protein
VTRQAPASTTTAALRIFGKLDGRAVVVPGLAPDADGEALDAAEAREAVTCETQAELKRHTSRLLARHPYVLLREALPEAPRARLLVGPERGLGVVLRVSSAMAAGAGAGWEAAMVPILRGEARELATLLGREHGCSPEGMETLLGQIATCASEHELKLDLLIHPADEPVVTLATGILKRAGRSK